MRASDLKAQTFLFVAVFTPLVLASLGPLLLPGYVLAGDGIFGPNIPIADVFFGFEVPVLGGIWPALLPFSIFSSLLPVWIVQKAVLFLTLFLPAMCAALAVPVRYPIAKLMAGVVYAFNPFVGARLLVGHWQLLLGYAFIPWAVVSFFRMLERPSKSRVVMAAGTTALVGMFSSHMLVLAFSVQGAIVSAYLLRHSSGTDRLRIIRAVGAFSAITLGLTAYWVVPSIVAVFRDAVPSLSGSDIELLGARPIDGNILLTLLNLKGFWGGAIDLPIPTTWASLFVLPVVIMTIFAFYDQYRNPLFIGLVSSGAVAILLASGANAPLGAVNRWLVDNVIVFSMFRETHKHLALLALTYAFSAGFAVNAISRPGVISHLRPPIITSIVAALITIQIAWMWPAWGWQGYLSSTYYPKDWSQAEAVLSEAASEGGVLFLPWHQYMTYSWLPQSRQTLKVPARHFFGELVVVARNMEAPGIYSQEQNRPVQRAVENALFSPVSAQVDTNVEWLGQTLTSIGFQWVLLAKEGDYPQYREMLDRQIDMEIAFEGPTIMVYRTVPPFHRGFYIDPQNGLPVPLEVRSNLPIVWEARGALGGSENNMLIPPNLDARHWAGGVKPPGGAVGVRIAIDGSGRLWFWPFFVSLFGLLVSLCTVVWSFNIVRRKRA